MNIIERTIMAKQMIDIPPDGLTVLSLFDGMSCGQIALNRAGIKVKKYYASEIDKPAIKVTMANYPDTVQLGDVTKWREWDVDWSSIDLLIGGSPCQGFSLVGDQLNFDDPRSRLFFEFADILTHIKQHNPNVRFLLENVRMKEQYTKVITDTLGVHPVFINSSLLSAQNRPRMYWANWRITQPKDKYIMLKDILQSEIDGKPVSAMERAYIENPQRSKYMGFGGDKSCTIMAGSLSKWQGTYIPIVLRDNKLHTMYEDDCGCVLVGLANDVNGHNYIKRVYSASAKSPTLCTHTGGNRHTKVSIDSHTYRRLTPIECERLQTVPDNYTEGVAPSHRYTMLGNGWTVDVIVHIFKCLYRTNSNL